MWGINSKPVCNAKNYKFMVVLCLLSVAYHNPLKALTNDPFFLC
jgi:hypothetical protein